MALLPDKKSPLPLILTVALVLAIGAAAFFSWSAAQAVRAKQSMFAQLNQAQTEKSQLSAELNQTKSDVKSLRAEADGLRAELNETKTKSLLLGQELKQKTEEVSQIQSRSEKRILELERDVKRYADIGKVIARELRPIKNALLGIEDNDYALVSGDSPRPAFRGVTVKNMAVSGSGRSLDLVAGKIVAINREYGFIVTDIGSAREAKVGHSLQLYRRDQPLGIGMIERVEENNSIVNVVSEDTLTRLRPGDRVVLL